MRSLDLVHRYFERAASRFDAIYEADKPLGQQIVDHLFRRVILARYRLVINACAAPGRTFLDVGCGPGRYPLELARRGAARTLGVDVAQEMIAIARQETAKAGQEGPCAWEVSDYLAWHNDERFDGVIAMGYYDYLEAPLPHLIRMIQQSRGHVFISFPKRGEWRMPIRKMRFALANGFVRFYNRNEVIDLFNNAASAEFLFLVDLGRDLVAIFDAASWHRASGR